MSIGQLGQRILGSSRTSKFSTLIKLRTSAPPSKEIGSTLDFLLDHSAPIRYWSLLQIRAAGHKTLRVKPLDDAAALNQGADVVSESFVFGVAAMAMLFELNRSNAAKERDGIAKKKKEHEKDSKLDERLRSIEDRLRRLEEANKKAAESPAAPTAPALEAVRVPSWSFLPWRTWSP
jgi:hypothetical protein